MECCRSECLVFLRSSCSCLFLQEELAHQEQHVKKLTDDLNAAQKEFNSQQEKIDLLQENIEQLKSQKSYLYQGKCKKLNLITVLLTNQCDVQNPRC